MKTHTPRSEFLISLGTLSLAACAGGGVITLPLIDKPGIKTNEKIPPINVVRSAAREVTAYVSDNLIFRQSYSSDGFTFSVNDHITTTPLQPFLDRTSDRILVNGYAVDMLATGTIHIYHENGKGHGVELSSTPDNKTFAKVCFGAGPNIRMLLPEPVWKPNLALTQAPRRTINARPVSQLSQSSRIPMFSQNSGSGSTLQVSGFSQIPNPGPGPGIPWVPIPVGGGLTLPPQVQCEYNLLLAAGLLSTSTAIDTALALALIAATGIGAVAEAIAAIVVALLSVGVAFTDDQVFNDFVKPCL